MDIDWARLRAAAVAVMGNAYAPYSNFPVGAAGLVDDGRVVVGCNVENAAYGVVLCAECGMVSALHAGGGGRLVAVSCVVATGEPVMPCGRCRQLLWENGGPECLVDALPEPVTVAELLPHAFGATDLAAAGAPVPPSAAAGAPVPPSVATGAPPRNTVPPRLLSWRGRGTVFVHPDVSGGREVWTGYWERSEGTTADETGILEEAPAWPDVHVAVEWARARTPRVVVVDAEGAMTWAGEGEPPAEIPNRWG